MICITYGKKRIQLRIRNEWLGEIEKIFIPLTERRKGYGTALLHEVEEISKKEGLKKLSLLSRSDNNPAISLYLKENYKIEGLLRNHFEKGTDVYILSKFI